MASIDRWLFFEPLSLHGYVFSAKSNCLTSSTNSASQESYGLTEKANFHHKTQKICNKDKKFITNPAQGIFGLLLLHIPFEVSHTAWGLVCVANSLQQRRVCSF